MIFCFATTRQNRVFSPLFNTVYRISYTSSCKLPSPDIRRSYDNSPRRPKTITRSSNIRIHFGTCRDIHLHNIWYNRKHHDHPVLPAIYMYHNETDTPKETLNWPPIIHSQVRHNPLSNRLSQDRPRPWIYRLP